MIEQPRLNGCHLIMTIISTGHFYFEWIHRTFRNCSKYEARWVRTYRISTFYTKEASRGAAAQSVTVKPTGCGFDPHSRTWNIYLNVYFHFIALVSRTSAALSSATQHTMPSEFGRKWGTECLNTEFLLPTLQCAGYSVKLIYFIFIYTKLKICHESNKTPINVCNYFFVMLTSLSRST